MYHFQNHTFDLGYATRGGAKMKFIWVIALLCLTPTVIAGNLEEVEELVNSRHFTQPWEEDVCHLPTTEVVGLPLRKKSRGVWQGDSSP